MEMSFCARIAHCGPVLILEIQRGVRNLHDAAESKEPRPRLWSLTVDSKHAENILEDLLDAKETHNRSASNQVGYQIIKQ